MIYEKIRLFTLLSRASRGMLRLSFDLFVQAQAPMSLWEYKAVWRDDYYSSVVDTSAQQIMPVLPLQLDTFWKYVWAIRDGNTETRASSMKQKRVELNNGTKYNLLWCFRRKCGKAWLVRCTPMTCSCRILVYDTKISQTFLRLIRSSFYKES